MARPWQRMLALVSTLCVMLGMVVQAPRGCTVCPIGCPMHVARPEQPGCHRGGMEKAHAAAPAPPARCAVRGTCGHLEPWASAALAVRVGPPTVGTRWRVTVVRPETSGTPHGVPPQPPTDPPRLLQA